MPEQSHRIYRIRAPNRFNRGIMRGLEKPRNPGMLLSPGDITYFYALFAYDVYVKFRMVSLMFSDIENELYDELEDC
jgi:hypothetical protein